MRVAAACAVGRLGKCTGQALVEEMITQTVDRLKNDRDAISRTG